MIYPGFILTKIASLCRLDTDKTDKITIDNHQSNGAQGVHQARVRLAGDTTTYRLILAPADAEIFINGDKRPVAEAFAQPLGDY